MRRPETYRGWRRNEAKRLKLLWRKLRREWSAIGQCWVMLP